MKSKQTFPFPAALDIERLHASEESFMLDSCQLSTPSPSTVIVQEEVKEPPEPNRVIANFAELLAQKIIQDAMQQWACDNIKYYNIPFIESEDSDPSDPVIG